MPVDLDDLWDELGRGKVYECSLRDPYWHLDGLCEGDSVYIDQRSAILLTLIHELIHRRKPRWGERMVERSSRQLFCKLTEAEKVRWWKAYRRIKQPRRPKAIE